MLKIPTILLGLLFIPVILLAAHSAKVDPNATLEDQSPIQCSESVIILDQTWVAPNGGEWRIFKAPGKDPAVVVFWEAGNDGTANEVYVNGREISIADANTMGHPCMLFLDRT